jgi:hypothetical protein
MSNNFKERTFVKMVERTAKRDAYETALRYLEHFPLEDAKLILQEKIDGHTEFLSTFDTEYNYGTQSLGPKMQYTVTVTDTPEMINE